jgi:hypothetical protein
MTGTEGFLIQKKQSQDQTLVPSKNNKTNLKKEPKPIKPLVSF